MNDPSTAPRCLPDDLGKPIPDCRQRGAVFVPLQKTLRDNPPLLDVDHKQHAEFVMECHPILVAARARSVAASLIRCP